MEQRAERNIAEDIIRSRIELGAAAMQAASRRAISADDAKALNLHLGVTDSRQILAHAKRKNKNVYLEEIASAIRGRRQHLETHRFIPMLGRLAETTMLALAVGEIDKIPLERAELLEHELVVRVSERRGINPNIVVDQTVINDLRWLSASTLPKRST